MTTVRTCDRCGAKLTRYLLKCRIGKKWEEWCEPCWKGFCDWYNSEPAPETVKVEEEVPTESEPQTETKEYHPRGGTAMREVYEAALSLKVFTNADIVRRCGDLTHNQVLHCTKALCMKGLIERTGGPRSGHYCLTEVKE